MGSGAGLGFGTLKITVGLFACWLIVAMAGCKPMNALVAMLVCASAMLMNEAVRKTKTKTRVILLFMARHQSSNYRFRLPKSLSVKIS